jgi:hypothetical protein
MTIALAVVTLGCICVAFAICAHYAASLIIPWSKQ